MKGKSPFKITREGDVMENVVETTIKRTKRNIFQDQEVIDEIRRLSQEEGLNDREIAAKLECCRGTITRVRNKYDIKKCDLKNKKDKSFVCCLCNKEIHIRRKELGEFICKDCKDKLDKGEITKDDINNLLEKFRNSL